MKKRQSTFERWARKKYKLPWRPHPWDRNELTDLFTKHEVMLMRIAFNAGRRSRGKK